MVGYLPLPFEFKGRRSTGKLYVVEKGPSVLGWTDQGELGIRLNPGAHTQVLLTGPGQETEDRKWKEDFPSVFSGTIGKLKKFTHRIRLKEGAVPVSHKARNIPILVRDAVQKELQRLEDNEIIEPIESAEWLAPLVVARKLNGNVRLFVDLRELNKNIVVDKFPLPRINEMVAKTKGVKWFSTIDLTSAYHQVTLHAASKALTSFITPFGCYQFRRMPFGLASAAAVFQKLMHRLFKGVEGVQYFQDDILIIGSDKADHDAKLSTVLHILAQNGLTAEWDKCKFRMPSVTYLGHKISNRGVKPKTANARAIREAPAPTSKEEVRSFLGMAEFYSKFVPHFATKTHNLRQLLKDKTTFVWTESTQEEFQRIKEEICEALPLHGFDPQAQSVLTTDASDKGLGAVLMQRNPDREMSTISFASRTLAPNEQKFSVVEKERLAAVWAIERFRQFLWGSRFLVRTDHKPLMKVFTSDGHANATPRIAKMTLKLLDYIYDVEYLPGAKNKVAEYLSRASEMEEAPKQRPEDEYSIAFLEDQETVISKQEWQKAYEEDQLLESIKQFIVQGWPDKKRLDSEHRNFYEIREELSLGDQGTFLWRGEKLVPPTKLTPRILALLHEGHLGISKTKLRVKQAYWWPALDKQVEQFVRECEQCSGADKAQSLLRPPLGKFDTPNNPWEEVSIDILGPILDGQGVQKYVIVLMDRYSKWPETEVRENVDTEAVLRFLTKMFIREGIPRSILCDNGPQFTSEKWKAYLERNGIGSKHTSVYHPASNGLAERFNRVIMGSVQAAISAGKNWETELLSTVWAYRITPTKTGYSPFKILRGRDLFTKDNVPWKQRTLLSKWSPAVVRHNLETAQRIYTEHFNKRHRVKETILEKGEWVRVKLAQLKRKGESKYSAPMQVEEVYQRAAKLSDGKV